MYDPRICRLLCMSAWATAFGRSHSLEKTVYDEAPNGKSNAGLHLPSPLGRSTLARILFGRKSPSRRSVSWVL